MASIPQFATNDYNSWSIQMKNFLRDEGVWDVIEVGIDEVLATAVTQREQIMARLRDERALTFLECSVDDESSDSLAILHKIAEAENAKTAWEFLKKAYQSVDEKRKEEEIGDELSIDDLDDEQLKICKSALVHEETRRKQLKLQLSESKASLDIVMTECLEVKSKVENMTARRAEEIISFRSSMDVKDHEIKEMELRITHLQQENQEAQNRCVGVKTDPPVAKLENKLKNLEETYSACLLTLKEIEDEWNNNLETTMEATKSYMSELKKGSEEIHMLHVELESCQLLLESSNEEKQVENHCKIINDILGNNFEKVVVSDCVMDSPWVLVTGEYGWTADMKRIKADSVLEEEEERGVAHIVEQLAFSATLKYTNHDIIKFLESIGAAFVACLNDVTTVDETIYELCVPVDKPGLLSQAISVLAEFSTEIQISEDDLKKERGAVMEEYRGTRNVTGRMQDSHWASMMADSKYAECLPIGTEEVIRKVSTDFVKRFCSRWYHLGNMAVIAVGDFLDT